MNYRGSSPPIIHILVSLDIQMTPYTGPVEAPQKVT